MHNFSLQITSVVVLCIWCVAANPGDPGIFKSAEHPKLNKDGRRSQKNSDHGLSQGGKMSSDGFNAVDNSEKLSSMLEQNDSHSWPAFSEILCFPFSCLCKRCFHADHQSSEQHMSEEGMFFFSLCAKQRYDQLMFRNFNFLRLLGLLATSSICCTGLF